MAIPASHIVKIEPRIIDAGSNDLVMSGLLLSKNPLSPTGEVLTFNTFSSVIDFFGDGTPEVIGARSYFLGYNNKFVSPKAFHVTRYIEAPVGAWLRGAAISMDLVDLKTITAGDLQLTIDAKSVALTGISLSSISTYSDIATIIKNKINALSNLDGVTVVYNTQTKGIQINSPSTGDLSEVTYATGLIAEALNLTEEAGGYLSQGSATIDPAGQMRIILEKTQNFVTFTTTWEPGNSEMLALAAWVHENYGYLYLPWTQNKATFNTLIDTDPASLLKNNEYNHVALIYGTLEHATFLMGTIASIPWARENGAINLAFKQQDGLVATVSDQTKAYALEGKNCNYYGNFATRNSEARFFYPGKLAASDYRYIDSYINSVWFNAMIQRVLFDGLQKITRVPYNTRGYTLISTWLMDPINQAINNGVVERGISLSETQKSELLNEAGLDISPEITNYGYYLKVADPGAVARNNRESPLISLWYAYAGSIQKLDVASTVVL
jgi:hypothetical protein